MRSIIYIMAVIFSALPSLVLANGADEYRHMMSWGSGMMNGAWSVLFIITWIVWIVVGILAAVWLWKQISKK